ncbi:hypothetical protein JCGZ_14870 [Jatropha curcas]|uniref:Uncharacterized protein n=1 Tax=Jatropha curcas TaxID=180498 RepID=A0A067KIV0_JATCU|nr:hypothetical protein JCGZ_14870 [Jatropha curcas]
MHAGEITRGGWSTAVGKGPDRLAFNPSRWNEEKEEQGNRSIDQNGSRCSPELLCSSELQTGGKRLREVVVDGRDCKER